MVVTFICARSHAHSCCMWGGTLQKYGFPIAYYCIALSPGPLIKGLGDEANTVHAQGVK